MLITRLFPLSDERVVLVHLASFDWDCTLGKAVTLRQGQQEVRARQVGAGNHEGHATIALLLDGDWTASLAELNRMEKAKLPITLEFS